MRTFEAAAYLRRNGADIVRVRKMFRDKMEEFKARAEAVRDAEVFENSFAIGVCPADGLESPTVTGAQAANELLNIVGIKATFVLTEYNNCIYISARSIDEVNVQLIMERLGGRRPYECGRRADDGLQRGGSQGVCKSDNQANAGGRSNIRCR